MSFGFSVGDFIAAIKLANKIRKEFVDAPSQLKGISDECVTLTRIWAMLTVLIIIGSEASRSFFKMPTLPFQSENLTTNKRAT